MNILAQHEAVVPIDEVAASEPIAAPPKDKSWALTVNWPPDAVARA